MPKKWTPQKYKTTTFYLTHSDQEMLSYLIGIYGSNASAVIRRLIIECYSILKYAEGR